MSQFERDERIAFSIMQKHTINSHTYSGRHIHTQKHNVTQTPDLTNRAFLSSSQEVGLQVGQAIGRWLSLLCRNRDDFLMIFC